MNFSSASPVTIEHLYALRNGLDLSNPLDAAIWGGCCITFWSCGRLRELLIPARTPSIPSNNIARTAALTFAMVNDTQYAWTKTTTTDGAVISITARSVFLAPIQQCEHPGTMHPSSPSKPSTEVGHRLQKSGYSAVSTIYCSPLVFRGC